MVFALSEKHPDRFLNNKKYISLWLNMALKKLKQISTKNCSPRVWQNSKVYILFLEGVCYDVNVVGTGV